MCIVEAHGGKRAARDMVYLQTYQAYAETKRLQSTNTPAKVLASYIQVLVCVFVSVCLSAVPFSVCGCLLALGLALRLLRKLQMKFNNFLKVLGLEKKEREKKRDRKKDYILGMIFIGIQDFFFFRTPSRMRVTPRVLSSFARWRHQSAASRRHLFSLTLSDCLSCLVNYCTNEIP